MLNHPIRKKSNMLDIPDREKRMPDIPSPCRPISRRCRPVSRSASRAVSFSAYSKIGKRRNMGKIFPVREQIAVHASRRINRHCILSQLVISFS